MIHKNYANRVTHHFAPEPKNVEILFSWLIAFLVVGVISFIAAIGWW